MRAKLSRPSEVKKTSEAKKPSKDSSLEEIFPVDKKPHQRSKKPLHRIDITDVDADEPDTTAVTSENIVDSDGKKFSEKLGMVSTTEAKVGVEKIKVISSTENVHHEKSPTSAGDENRVVERPSAVGAAQKKVEEEIMKSMSNKLSIEESSGSDDSSSKFKKPPKSSVQFISEWKQIKTSAGKAKYVRLLPDPAKDYARIFKHSMESNIFNDLVKLLSSSDIFCDPTEVCQHLVGISRVPRIVALVMFLSSEEKQLLQDLVENFVRNNSALQEEQKSQVLKAFR